MKAGSYSEMVSQRQENLNLDEFFIQSKSAYACSGVIIMICHKDEKNMNRYPIWGMTLAERTGKSVIIPNMNCSTDDTEFYDCLMNIVNRVKAGEYPLLKQHTRVDFFTNGNGIDRALKFLSSHENTDLNSSKVFILDDYNHFSNDLDYSSGRIFRISLDKHIEKPLFYSKRENPVQGYSSLNLNLSYNFSTNNLFPVKDDADVKSVDYQYDKVFKMASWFLCGIN